MVAAPQYATFQFVGVSGKTYFKDAYLSDATTTAQVNFDGGAGAGANSPVYWKCPEDCALVDFAINTGMTDTTNIRLTVNGAPTGHVLRYAQHVNTIATRPAINIGFEENAEFGAIQA